MKELLKSNIQRRLENDSASTSVELKRIPFELPYNVLADRGLVSYLEWVQDLESVPDAEQAQWIYDSLEDKANLHIFGRYFFPHIIKGEDDVPECHIDLTLEIGRREDGGIIFPRGFAKSTWVKIDLLHDIVYGLEPVILYIGKTLQDAGFHFEAIKSELENNELLIDVYGDLVPPETDIGRKWTNKHFQTTNGVNVVARGAGKGRGVNIKNQRPTKIICDDIEDDEQIRSPERCQKLHRWLYEVIFPSKDARRGFVKMIGTVLAKHAEVLKFYQKHGGIFRKAIENGQSIWAAMWSMEKLQKEKEKIGSRAFSQEYQNTPIDEESAIIKPIWISANTYDVFMEDVSVRKVIMMDPQAGEGESADNFGLIVLAWKHGDKHRYVLERIAGKASQSEQAAIFVSAYQRHPNAHVCGIEKILTQVAVYQYVLDWKNRAYDFTPERCLKYKIQQENRNIPLLAVRPEGKDGGKLKDKVARLQMHEAAFERGEVHLHHTMVELADQLSGFPNLEHDDDVDALMYCLDWSYKNAVFPSSQTGEKKNDDRKVPTFGNIEKKRY